MSDSNGWFGKRPFGPICEAVDHEPTPVGAPCAWCSEPIAAGDDGLFIVHLHADGATRRPMHQECAARMVIGSEAHIEGRCSCFGGPVDDEDEAASKGLSQREAARRAVAAYERSRGRKAPQ